MGRRYTLVWLKAILLGVAMAGALAFLATNLRSYQDTPGNTTTDSSETLYEVKSVIDGDTIKIDGACAADEEADEKNNQKEDDKQTINSKEQSTPSERNSTTNSSTSNSTADCNIKGNISSSGEKIYHVPGQKYYNSTRIDTSAGERWFCSEAEAQSAGWRKSKV